MAELFENIEVNREPRWPIVTKLVCGSLVVHTGIILAIIFSPTVRTGLALAQAFSGATYVDEDYQKTQIQDRAIMLSLKDGKFEYPPGYFQEPLTWKAEAAASPTPTPPEAKIISEFKPEKEAKPTPSPGASPAPSPGSGTTATGSAQNSNTADSKAAADKALDQMASEANVTRPDESKINKRPLKDWVASANKLKVARKLDLNQMVEIQIEADRQSGGKLENVQVTQKNGDPQLIQVAKDLAAAISDSGVLYFLTDTKHLQITLHLDATNVTARVTSDVGSEDRAKELSKTFGGFLTMGTIFKKGQDEETIYRAAKVASDGKQVVVNFSMPRETATGILKKYTDVPPAPSPENKPVGAKDASNKGNG